MTWLDYDWTWVQRLIIYISKLILEKRRTNALNVTSQYQVFRSELRIVLCQIISPSLFSPHSCWTGGRLTNRSQKCADHKTFWCLLPLCFTTWMVLLYTCGRNAYCRHKNANDIFHHTHFIWVALQITPKERPQRRKSLNFWTLPK